MELQDNYTYAWIAWLVAFLVIEGKAIVNKDKGDTLSEHVWKWFKIDEGESNWHLSRIALTGFMGWLVAHFVWRVI